MAPGRKRVPLCPTGSKFLPGYKFVQQLGRTPTAETWAAQTKEGQRKQVQLLYGLSSRDKRAFQEIIERLQSDCVMPACRRGKCCRADRAACIVVRDLIGDCFRDRFQEQRGRGLKGLARRELLDWLWTAAETLDELAKQHQLQHLGLNPRNLLLEEGRLLIGDYGIQALLRQSGGQLDAPGQGRYAAPELVAGKVSPHCDQYSLAVIYQEMLTGSHASPRRNRLSLSESGMPSAPAPEPRCCRWRGRCK